MTESEYDPEAGEEPSPLDRVWRAEEGLLHALIEDIRTLRACTGGDPAAVSGDAWGDSSGEAIAVMPGGAWETPAGETPNGRDEGPREDDAARDVPDFGWPAEEETGLWAGGSTGPEAGPGPGEASPDAATPAGDGAGADVVAALTAIEEETGDCFCYEIVDANGEPCDHPFYELAGHEIRRRAGSADGGAGVDSVWLKVTNAAGDARIAEYAIASGELADRGRVEPGGYDATDPRTQGSDAGPD